jgi:hypothetical protein
MPPHNDGMKTSSKYLARERLIRRLCLIATGMLFLFSAFELVLGAGGDVGIWRGMALSSLYLSICLMQRRHYVPSSRWVIRPRRYSQLVD